LSRQGAVVYGADIAPDADSADVTPVCLDVRDPVSWAALARRLEAEHGRLDILVHCAGAYLVRDTSDTDFADWSRVVDTNLTGTFLCLRALAPLLAASDEAAVVMIASTLAVKSRAAMGAYAASKAGALSLTRSFALEQARKGTAVRVNALAPGPTDTGIAASLGDETLAALGGHSGVMDRARASVPLQRIAAPEEIAAAALFLLGPNSRFMTGSCLTIDGGQSA
jgi:3alpha(or 20beta)-hydroxysteroid dehydrogenase